MTMKEWFNSCGGILALQDVYVTLFRERTFSSSDVILDTKVDLSDAIDLFGSWECQRLVTRDSYFRFLLWPPVEKVIEPVDNE